MTKYKFECDSCDAFGSITYNLDEEFYSVTSCPFCGSDISDEESDISDYDDE